MSDSDELDLEGGEQSAADGSEDSSKKKKGAALAVLLPNLLKWGAIGLVALILVVTVAIITVRLTVKGGQPQTAVAESASPYTGSRPQYQPYDSIGQIRTRTKDATPYSVVVEMVIMYDMNDKVAQDEFNTRRFELKDFVRSFFSSKYAAELQPDNEARLKQEIIEALNTRVLDKSKARIVTFNQLDVMEM
ncbi:hypothetical protein FACS189483_02270 [Spirochaetia bacterium]|nr:hypothetical protein FACS189483_02270 [Spirochaetia bacterium]